MLSEHLKVKKLWRQRVNWRKKRRP